MKVAAHIGISIEDFWYMTVGELKIYAEAFTEKAKLERDDRLTLEYLNASWQRAKKMPDLKKYINDKPNKNKTMTDNQMFGIVAALNAAFGGKVVDKK